VLRVSAAAQRIIVRWFGRFGSELPEQLADWLRSPFPREPLRVERGRERLVAETPTRGTVVLHEECLATKPLTAREQEIMRHVEGGMSTDEIAHALCVTPGTVSKHLEHIYRKLGVAGRTAALAALRRTRT
jgi:DNA-binding CsgD family transcriptional regulator